MEWLDRLIRRWTGSGKARRARVRAAEEQAEKTVSEARQTREMVDAYRRAQEALRPR